LTIYNNRSGGGKDIRIQAVGLWALWASIPVLVTRAANWMFRPIGQALSSAEGSEKSLRAKTTIIQGSIPWPLHTTKERNYGKT
jgi:hypothetical protein